MTPLDKPRYRPAGGHVLAFDHRGRLRTVAEVATATRPDRRVVDELELEEDVDQAVALGGWAHVTYTRHGRSEGVHRRHVTYPRAR